jgi:hypothetical protein
MPSAKKQVGQGALWRRRFGFGLALTTGGWVLGLPLKPEAQLGTFRDGPTLTAAHVQRHSQAFSGAVLDWRADLMDADLSGCTLDGADLAGVDLTGAILAGANLEGTDCSDAILRNADLTGAKLGRVNLVRADLTGARLPEGALADADGRVGGVQGRETRDEELAGESREPGIIFMHY